MIYQDKYVKLQKSTIKKKKKLTPQNLKTKQIALTMTSKLVKKTPNSVIKKHEKITKKKIASAMI